MTRLPFPAALLAASALLAPLRADPPVASYVYPAGGQRGTVVQAHVAGLNLNESCTLEVIGPGVTAPALVKRTTSPWFEGPLLPLREAQQAEDYPKPMAAALTLDAKAGPGTRHLVLRTSQGITAPLRFVVGDYPEVQENEAAVVPFVVTLPATANGRIFPRGNVDEWAVTLKKGQTLTCATDAATLGSPLLPHLEIVSPDGRSLAESESGLSPDPQLRVQAPADGVYRVRIRDAGLKGGQAYVYRLTLTAGPWVDSVFPLGGKRGSTVALETTGVNLPKTLVNVSIPGGTPAAFAAAPVAGANPVWLDADDLPEVNEGEPLPIPGVANGRIAKPGETDAFGFTAKKGDRISFELLASRFGSPLLGMLTVIDANGKDVAKAEPGATLLPGADTTLEFTAPADGTYRVAVRDRFRSRGSPSHAYRLKARPKAPGFELTAQAPTLTVPRGGKASLKIAVARSGGFTGPIDLSVESLPAGVSVPEKLAANPNQATVDVAFTATADAAIRPALLRVVGTSRPTPALPAITREAAVAVGPGEAPIAGVRLAVALATPFKIVGEYQSLQQPRGTRYAKKYRIERTGYDGPIEITLADRQARHLQGVAGPAVRVPAGATEFTFEVDLPPWMDMTRTSRVCVMGSAKVKDADGSEHAVTFSSTGQNDQMIAVMEPGRLGLDLDAGTVAVVPGQTARVELAVSRAKGLTGAATLEVVIPPSAIGVTAKAEPVPANQERGVIVLHFSPAAKGPFPVPLTIRTAIATPSGPVTAEESLTLVPLETPRR